jgi:hypothetical protein
MARVPDDWDNLMGAVAELTHLTRADFERPLWFHGCSFKKDDDRWQIPNTKTYPTFREFATARATWAVRAVKEAQACRSLLEDNKPFEVEWPEWNGHGHDVKKLVITPRGAEQSNLDAMIDEVPFV